MFNEREKFILQILLKNIGEALSIKEIAKATKIKERTLYREIKNLEDSLQRLGIELVKEKSRYILKGNVSSLDSSLFNRNKINFNIVLFNLKWRHFNKRYFWKINA